MNNLEFRVPKNEDEFNEYDLFRWRLLRKPIGKTGKNCDNLFFYYLHIALNSLFNE